MMDQATRLYTAEQVRRLDRCAIDGHGIPGIDLMERAGKAVFDSVLQVFPGAQRWLVLCGAGNNGGDGYIVARLALENGLEADVCPLKDPETLKGDAALAVERWRDAGGFPVSWPLDNLDAYDVIVDALLGTGLDRAPEGVYADAIDAVNGSDALVVAVDIPSGLNADTGAALGTAVAADLTVTFIGSKRGLFTADGPDFVGDVLYDDLETPDSVRDSEGDSGILIQEEIISDYLPLQRLNAHKGDFGSIAVVGSDLGMSGAVRLAGEAALRAGAGKVTIGTRPEHSALVNASCPELMSRGIHSADELVQLLAASDVVVAGTGLGRSDWSAELLEACLSACKPLVLDADGLSLLAERKDDRKSTGECGRVLTPHPGEAARLLGVTTKGIQSDRVGSALKIAEAYGSVTVLKGCGTVIAHPDGRYAICPLGNPGMATAGSGDVLAGVIGAMLAQGLDDWRAAQAGVVVHAAAGDLAAEQIGQRGMLAGDITTFLPAVLEGA